MPSNFKYKISINDTTLIFQDLPAQQLGQPFLIDGTYKIEIYKDNNIIISDNVIISNPEYED